MQPENDKRMKSDSCALVDSVILSKVQWPLHDL